MALHQFNALRDPHTAPRRNRKSRNQHHQRSNAIHHKHTGKLLLDIYLPAVNLFIHLIHIIPGSHRPSPGLKQFAVGDLRRNRNTVRLRKVKLVIPASGLCRCHDILCHLHTILIRQVISVIPFLIRQNRMFDQYIIRSVYPYVPGCIIPVTHSPNRIRRHLLCLFFRQFSALAPVIIAPYHGKRRLNLRFNLHRISICHRFFIQLHGLVH